MNNNTGMNTGTDILCMITGTLTSIGVGVAFLHALAAFSLAIIGALGSWVFVRFIKPQLEKLFGSAKVEKQTKSLITPRKLGRFGTKLNK